MFEVLFFLYAAVRECYDGTPQHWFVSCKLEGFRGRSVFWTAQLGDLAMMTFRLKRSVLLCLCVASVLFSGCVSQGKYDELQGQYNGLQGQYNGLQGQYNGLQSQYKQLQQTSANQAAQNAAITAELATTKHELAAKGAQAGRLQEAIRYTVNSDQLFRSGSWEMSPQGKDVIGKIAPQLAPYQQTKLLVNGYTDNAPISPALKKKGITSNEVLSQKRAEAVMAYLIAQGVKPDMISARGLGEANPIAPNTTAKGRAQNRRVEVTLAEPTSP